MITISQSKQNAITAEELRALLHYDPETGDFTWLKRLGGRRRIGDKAGTLWGGGYLAITIRGQLFMAHRLAWVYVHGRWPKDIIDHIDGDKLNNRLSNLRECSARGNAHNQKSARGSSSRYVGVTYDPKSSKLKPWRAQIRADYKIKHLGGYATEEEAAAAYAEAKRKLHEFASEAA